MIKLDLVHLILGFWVKPLLWTCVIFSIAQSVYTYNASARHNFLLCGMLVITLGVLFHFFTPVFSVPILPDLMADLSAFPVSLPITHWFVVQNVPLLLMTVFILGFFWIVTYQVLGVRDVLQLIRRADPVSDHRVVDIVHAVFPEWGVDQKIKIVKTRSLSSPVVFGFLKPVLILPYQYLNWDEDRLHRILLHELAHIHRYDWLTKVVMRFLCALFWFVPVFWWAVKKLEWNSEAACDNVVLNKLNCRAEYAEDLLDMEIEVIQNTWLLSFIKKTELFSRINHVLDGRYSRLPVKPQLVFVHLIVSILLVLPFSLVRAVPIIHPDEQPHFFILDLNSHSIESNVGPVPQDEPEAITQARLKPLLLKRNSPLPGEEEVIITLDVKQTEVVSLQAGLWSDSIAELENFAATLNVSELRVQGFIPQKMKTPNYPRGALLDSVEGFVQIEFDISLEGVVENIRVLASNPQGVFEPNVIAAIQASRYIPMYMGDEPVKTKNVQQTYVFQLNKSTSK
ncbi:Regulatory protein BlaR1 [Thalassocella blandensis]|nr:Regulatory protein BlaR1 [Thalassocella blandensis]